MIMTKDESGQLDVKTAHLTEQVLWDFLPFQRAGIFAFQFEKSGIFRVING